MSKLNKVLIANRGEIACRILRTLKKCGITTVMVYHAVDADSIAVQEADEAIEIFADVPVSAYLDINQMVEACKTSGVQAVHPGFGFLAENPLFASALDSAGVTFIGPRADTIQLMGNKVAARAFCLENGFPLAPSATNDGDMAKFLAAAREIGTPLLLKAAAGGGGKGMHIIHDISELDQAVKKVSMEAERYFGDGEIYAEKYIENPRHIEVQVLGDQHGNVIHLGERECSIQRRFQKVVEEAPSPTINEKQRSFLCHTAVDIAKKVNYVGAGTIEFIVDQSGDFYFLEMNTRIQVEHPVTEMITGLDIVEQQIRVAEGEFLPDQKDVSFSGHSIEVRLYAEDPQNDFAPSTGKLIRYSVATNEHVRLDNGVLEGQSITSSFDPMIAKLIAHGGDRRAAIEHLKNALKNTIIFGVENNVEYLLQIVNLPAFVEAKLSTNFLKQHEEILKPVDLNDDEKGALMAAVALISNEFVDARFFPPEPIVQMGHWRN